MSTFFTADWHLRHANIIKYCRRLQFMTPEEIMALDETASRRDAQKRLRLSVETIDRMENAFISTANVQAKKNDTIWILGDWLWTGHSDRDPVRRAQDVLDRIDCKNVYFVYGNHDDKRIGRAFTKCYDKVTISVEGQKIQLNHEAIAIWDCRHHGAWHLYGHSHSRAENWLDEIMPGRYSIDVGIDNAFRLFGEYRMFSFAEIRDMFAKRPGFGLIHNDELKGEN